MVIILVFGENYHYEHVGDFIILTTPSNQSILYLHLSKICLFQRLNDQLF